MGFLSNNKKKDLTYIVYRGADFLKKAYLYFEASCGSRERRCSRTSLDKDRPWSRPADNRGNAIVEKLSYIQVAAQSDNETYFPIVNFCPNACSQFGKKVKQMYEQ